MRDTRMNSWLTIIAGVFVMMNICGCSDGFKYSRYSSKDPELNLTIDYISGWRSIEHRGENNMNASVLFFEDKAGNVFKAKVSLTAIDISKSKIKPTTIDRLADSISAATLKFEGSKVLSRSKIKFLGTDAVELLFSYKTLDRIYVVNSKLIPAEERMIIFERGDKFYTIRYENREEDFEKLSKAFDHMIRTLRFKSGG